MGNKSFSSFRMYSELYNTFLNPKLRTQQCMDDPELSEAFNAKKEGTLESIVKLTEIYQNQTSMYLSDEMAKMIYQ